MQFSKLEKENKFILFSVAAAFVLSFMLGGIARNPVAVILVRAIVSSALFGGIMLGAVLIVKRYLPDMAAERRGESRAPTVGDEEHLGRRVDYSIAEEEDISPAAGQYTSPSGDEEGGAGEEEEWEREPAGGPTFNEETDSEEELPSLERLFDEQERDLVPDLEEDEQPRSDARNKKNDYLYVRDAHFPNDPETIAKAVKKVMKQDEQ